MPRRRRNFIPGRCYEVSQVGNKLYPLYLDAEDHRHALHLLRICALRYGVLVHAHHYEEHQGAWLMEPSSPRAISNLMRDMQSQLALSESEVWTPALPWSEPAECRPQVCPYKFEFDAALSCA